MLRHPITAHSLSHRSSWRLLGLGLLLGLLLCPVRLRAAQVDDTVIRPEPAVLEIGQGQVETVQIVLENAQAVYGIDLRIRFDPAVVQVVDADPSRDGIQMTPGAFVQPDFLVRNAADNQAGSLQYVVSQVNPTSPANGTGVVLTIEFQGQALGEQSELTIGFVEIADRRGNKLSVQPQNGTLKVIPPRPETPTPAPTATATVPPPTAVRSTSEDKAVAASVSTSSSPASKDTWFVLIATGGFVATAVVLVVALRMRPGRRSRSSRKARSNQ